MRSSSLDLLPQYPIPSSVPATVAGTRVHVARRKIRLRAYWRFVSDKKILLVHGAGCEHVVDVAATLAERVVNEHTTAHAIATGREALRRPEGEHVYLLRALPDCPPEDARDDRDGRAFVSGRPAFHGARRRRPAMALR